MIQSSSCITGLEIDVVESDDGYVFEILIKYFVNITKTLCVANEHDHEPLNNHDEDPCLTIIPPKEPQISPSGMLEQLQNLDPKKGSP